MIPVGSLICRLNGKSYRYPEQEKELKDDIQLLNQILVGSCYQEGGPADWHNFYPPNCVAILYEKVDSLTYKRIGTITIN